MKLRNATLSLVICVCAAALHAGAEDSKQALSNTVSSDRTVQILWDPTAPPPDINGVLRLVAAQAGETGKQLLGVEPDVARTLFGWAPKLTVGDHSCTISFYVRLQQGNQARLAAREFGDRLVEILTDQLRQMRRENSAQQLNRARDYAGEVQSQLEALRRRRREMQAKLVADSGRADASPEGLAAAVAKLEDERQRLELELAGMEARLEAVQEQFEKSAERAEKDAASDPVVRELEQAVVARDKVVELTRKRVQAGAGTPQELSAAEAELSQARVQFLERKAAGSTRGGELLAPLTREMQALGIDIRDRKARLAQVAKRLAPLRDVADQLEEIQSVQDQVQSVSRTWEGAQALLRDAHNRAELGVVDRVIVIDAGDVKAQPAGDK